MNSSPKKVIKRAAGEPKAGKKRQGGKQLKQPTPIIITGGSLTIESRNVDFSQFTPEGARKLHHPRNAKILSVDIVDGDDINGPLRVSYVPPANGKCVIVINY